LRAIAKRSGLIRFDPVCGLYRAQLDNRRARGSLRAANLEDRLVIATVSPPAEAALIDVRAVAALLDCSTRHVYRLADADRMPAPVRIGALVRWRRAEIEEWIAAGCPSTRRATP
jgi:excisionase family DNA binding protein